MMSDTTTRRRFLGRSVQTLGVLAVAGRARGGDEAAGRADELTDKAVAFLKGGQEPNGGWSTARKEPGITSLAVTALLRSGRVSKNDPAVTRGLGYLEQFLGPKGGLSEAAHANYATAVALLAFHDANAGGRYDRVIKDGQAFLKSMQ